MHQSQGMAHLVRSGVLDGFAHDVVVELKGPCAFVYGSCLNEAPVVEQ